MDKVVFKIGYGIFLLVFSLLACTKENPGPDGKSDEKVCRLAKTVEEYTDAQGDMSMLESEFEYDNNNHIAKVVLTQKEPLVDHATTSVSYFYNSGGQLSSLEILDPEKQGVSLKYEFNYMNNRLEGYSYDQTFVNPITQEPVSDKGTLKLNYSADGKVNLIIDNLNDTLNFGYQGENVASVFGDEQILEFSGYDNNNSAYAGVNTSLAHQIVRLYLYDQDINLFSKNNASIIRSFDTDNSGAKVLDYTRDITYEYNELFYPKSASYIRKDRGGTRLSLTAKILYFYTNCP